MNGTITVRSDEMQADTDDGVDDEAELRRLHTDPNDTRTYSITTEHQTEIVAVSSVDRLETLSIPTAAGAGRSSPTRRTTSTL